VLPHASIGHGDTTAVFLHQTDGDGLCGWWPYANWVSAHYRTRAVIVDLCGFGEGRCPTKAFDNDQLAQVAFVVRQVRATHPRRLVLVGASMGGSLALAAGAAAGANAVVDLSGPPDWIGAPALPAVRRLRAPLLVASSPGDPSTNYSALRAAFNAARASPKKFVRGTGEHGWALLSATSGLDGWHPLAATVGRWIVGDYR
jgi:dienelactone hydrolase